MKDKTKDKVPIGVVNSKLRNQFQAYCDKMGFVKSRAVEGAIVAFMDLTPEKQLELIKNANDIPKSSTNP